MPSHSVKPEVVARISMKLKWEAHLMVRDAEKHFANLRLAAAKKVIFTLRPSNPRRGQSRRRGVLAWPWALRSNLETPAAAVLPLASRIDSFLILSVKPGFYGARFIPETMQKIADLRATGKEIGIDGGIKQDNIAEVARSGVSSIYVGSAIFLQSDPGQAYRDLQAKATAA